MECLELAIPPLPQLLTVGHALWPIGMKHFERNFPVYDILIVIKGTMFQSENDIPYELVPGSVLVLEPDQTHWGHRPCEEETEMYWFHLHHEPPSRRIESDQIPWTNVLKKGTDFDIEPSEHLMYLPKFTTVDLTQIKPILDKMVQIHNQFSVHNALQLHSLMVQLLHHLQLSVQAQHSSRSLIICQLVIQFLQTHYANPIHSADMEEALHFHFDYLSRCLKKHTGMTTLAYLNYVRIEEAKKLLLNSNFTLQQIAEMTGIPQVNYFIRLFRKSVGVTPGVFRQTKQGFV